MQQRIQTKAIVLKRVDYEESDRIVTFLSPEHGQIACMAKGVKKSKSKLAGGIELFSLSDITLIKGKRDLHTLVSSRIDTHFGKIISSYERVELGYAIIQHVYRATQDVFEEGVFEILLESLTTLDDENVAVSLTALRFYLFMLQIHGQLPDLRRDADGKQIIEESRYFLDISSGNLIPAKNGEITSDHIKVLRLCVQHDAKKISRIAGADTAAYEVVGLIEELFNFVF